MLADAIVGAGTGLGRPLLVALDGRSGTGKTTLARELALCTGGRHITADDFWAGGPDDVWASLPPAERAERAIDWRRLRAQVLEPLRAGRPARWHTFDWQRGQGLSPQPLTCAPASVVVVDGAYSARPELADMIDLAVLVQLDERVRRARLAAREGEAFMCGWHGLWDAAEDHYFGSVRLPEAFDLVFNAS